MTRLIAITPSNGGKVWICPEHVIKLTALGEGRTSLTFTSGYSFEVGRGPRRHC
jgi:competence transcription factor ComK